MMVPPQSCRDLSPVPWQYWYAGGSILHLHSPTAPFGLHDTKSINIYIAIALRIVLENYELTVYCNRNSIMVLSGDKEMSCSKLLVILGGFSSKEIRI